jgi:hypothetical protein
MLIERLIVETRLTHLDPDGIALGLIGVLEMLWQDFAFQTEVSIDRYAARQRAMAYLRSIFPGQFAPGGEDPAHGLTGMAPDSSSLFEIGRRDTLHGSGQLAGLEAQIAVPGDFLTVETATERVLLLRDAAGAVRAWRISRL